MMVITHITKQEAKNSYFVLSSFSFSFFNCRNALDHKFIGCPICIENAKYSRNALLFNVCFVLGPNVDTICYEGVVKKLAGYMTSLEVTINTFFSLL